MQIENVVIDYRDRPDGSFSKLNTYSDGFKVIFTIIRLLKNYKPFMFFTTIASALSLIVIAFFIPILIHFIQTHLVPNFPTLIVCVFVELSAIQTFFSGIILSSLSERSRRDFEMQLIETENELQRLTKE